MAEEYNEWIEEHGGNLVFIWLMGLFFATVSCYAADVWFELTTLARVILVLTLYLGLWILWSCYFPGSTDPILHRPEKRRKKWLSRSFHIYLFLDPGVHYSGPYVYLFPLSSDQESSDLVGRAVLDRCGDILGNLWKRRKDRVG